VNAGETWRKGSVNGPVFNNFDQQVRQTDLDINGVLNLYIDWP
jgi:hypothetical protein